MLRDAFLKDGFAHVPNALDAKTEAGLLVDRVERDPQDDEVIAAGGNVGNVASCQVTRAWGYVYRDGDVSQVTAMSVDSYGSATREFEATLEDGNIVRGTATVVREVSVPIEGTRRPGATVLVESDLGPMVGVPNDWDPKGTNR